MKGGVFITGATGLIGGEIAWRLMASGCRVWCLVRGSSFAEAAARLEKRFALSGQACDWNRVVALPGDVTHDRLGLDDHTLRHLGHVCAQVIHCAADTSFAARNRCALVNRAGTQHVLEVCQALGPRIRLFHMSSAVACMNPGGSIIHEDDTPAGFSNDYINSKRAGEEIVRRSSVDAIILRPSIVLSQGVKCPRYARAILWVLPVMRRLGVLPLTGEEPIDAVSVQFVSECVARMLDRSLAHPVYHLSSGPEFSITLKVLFQSLAQQGHDFSQVGFDPDLDWAGYGTHDDALMRWKGFIDYYLPFLGAGAVYDRSRLNNALGGVLPPCPKLSEYCAELLEQFTEHEACEEALKP